MSISYSQFGIPSLFQKNEFQPKSHSSLHPSVCSWYGVIFHRGGGFEFEVGSGSDVGLKRRGFVGDFLLFSLGPVSHKLLLAVVLHFDDIGQCLISVVEEVVMGEQVLVVQVEFAFFVGVDLELVPHEVDGLILTVVHLLHFAGFLIYAAVYAEG
jgi:hypothetical protein